MTETNYDTLLNTSEHVAIAKGDEYVFTPEAPIDVALEWIDFNTNPKRMEGITGRDRMDTNYGLIFGDHYAEMKERGVGSMTMDEMYQDLLEHWSLFTDPSRARKRRGIREVSEIIDELREALLASPESEIALAASDMVAAVDAVLADAGSDSAGE